MRLGHLAIALLLVGLALLPVPRLWRLGAALLMIALVLAPTAIVVEQPGW